MGQGNPNVDSNNYLGNYAEWLDIQFAKQLCTDLNLDFTYIDIYNEYEESKKYYKKEWSINSQLPRIRANHLYSLAEEHDLIAVGSTNGSELILSSFSTGGPAGNIAPLIDLYKVEVYGLAIELGLPDYIINRKPLISELNIADDQLYGGELIDSTIIDPILRRLWYLKESPEKISKDLGHSKKWINDIYKKRIVGESARRGYKSLIINRPIIYKDIEPDVYLNRDYFI